MAIVDYFLKIEGIPGDSNDDKHKNEIDVLSFGFEVSRPKPGGRPRVEDFRFVKTIDTATPLLFDAACPGESIRSAVMTGRKAGRGQQEFMKFTFEDVVVSSVQPTGATGSDALPMEQVTLDFRSVEIEVRRQNPDGSFGPAVTSTCSPRVRRGE